MSVYSFKTWILSMIIISVIKSHTKKSNLLVIKVKLHPHPHPLVPKRNDQEHIPQFRKRFLFSIKSNFFWNAFLVTIPTFTLSTRVLEE
jgi:hypothetical protein